VEVCRSRVTPGKHKTNHLSNLCHHFPMGDYSIPCLSIGLLACNGAGGTLILKFLIVMLSFNLNTQAFVSFQLNITGYGRTASIRVTPGKLQNNSSFKSFPSYLNGCHIYSFCGDSLSVGERACSGAGGTLSLKF